MEINQASSDREKIAARLKEARTLSGLSQSQAADKLEIPRPAISEIESGKRKVSAEEIIQFASLYKVDAKWLLLQSNEDYYETEEQRFAARELSKLNKEAFDQVMALIKMITK